MHTLTGGKIKGSVAPASTTSGRYLSVDFLRGLTVAFMILVNTPGTWDYVYKPLRHADWHGCTPTDIVFPCFLFIIGISMWFSFGKFGRRLTKPAALKVLKRVVLMFAIGMLLNKFPVFWRNLDHWHVMGVLQRIALAYGLAALLVLALSRNALYIVSTLILLLYWGIMHWFASPGGDPYGLNTNALLRFDGWLYGLEVDAVAGIEHIFYGSKHIYLRKGFHFDSMGVLSTLPSIVSVIIGWFCGQWMDKWSGNRSLLIRNLLLYGVILGVAGLCWNYLGFPINKKLWTSSYVLYAGGIAIILMATSIWLIDVQKWRMGTGFFFTFGANPLFAFVLSEGLAQILCAIEWTEDGVPREANWWLYKTFFRPIDGAELGSFLFALAFMLVCWLVCRWLYVRKIMIKI
ncbi:MAG: hypothetical protein H6565_06955 [Lewinellaceae bacterium]|nr:hypothetical protein [Lewinellaceae bacterium]MCB9353748.1 hypothetical protein [Lewinellaceae bacterium]